MRNRSPQSPQVPRNFGAWDLGFLSTTAPTTPLPFGSFDPKFFGSLGFQLFGSLTLWFSSLLGFWFFGLLDPKGSRFLSSINLRFLGANNPSALQG